MPKFERGIKIKQPRLLRKECIGEQCVWWVEAESEEDSQCVFTSFALLPDLLVDVVSGLEDVKTKMMGVSSTIDSYYG